MFSRKKMYTLTTEGGGGNSKMPTAVRSSSTLADITSLVLTGLISTLIFLFIVSSSESSDEESNPLLWLLKSDQGSFPRPPEVGGGGCFEYPSSSTSGVGVPDLWTSSPSLPMSLVLSTPSSSLPVDFFFLSFLLFLRRKPKKYEKFN